MSQWKGQTQVAACNNPDDEVAAFAAILADGCVVAWGSEDSGGNCSSVQEQLKNVQGIQTSESRMSSSTLISYPVLQKSYEKDPQTSK